MFVNYYNKGYQATQVWNHGVDANYITIILVNPVLSYTSHHVISMISYTVILLISMRLSFIFNLIYRMTALITILLLM